MLSTSNISIPKILQKFKDRGIKVGFLVPTENALDKSIFDAHNSLRIFLKDVGAHDYDKQIQGQNHKVKLETLLFAEGVPLQTKTSLYRPTTKEGDPRICIYNLKSHAKAGDLIALAYKDKKLIAINCSNSNLDQLLLPSDSILGSLFPKEDTAHSAVAEELLEKLRSIASKGFIQTLRSGDTGVGYTLETLLAIQANSSKAPDYFGIELKSGRINKAKNKQSTVFSQVPNWAESRLKGSKDILKNRGRFSKEKNRNQLNHEISCLAPNSYCLQLELTEDPARLHQVFIDKSQEPPEKVRDVLWDMDRLISRAEEKHRETMWVSAETRGRGKNEEFWYREVKHTTGLDASALPLLLESGFMTVHYLIKETPSGGAKDQGYLFKMAPRFLPLLFKDTKTYSFAE